MRSHRYFGDIIEIFSQSHKPLSSGTVAEWSWFIQTYWFSQDLKLLIRCLDGTYLHRERYENKAECVDGGDSSDSPFNI